MSIPDAEKLAERRAEREAMVRHQIEARGVGDLNVLAALRKVPRHRFVPPSLQDLAYGDHPLPIGEGQTISQPYIVGYMTEQLAVQPGLRVLEIGSGCGYQTAILLELEAQVHAVELLAPIAREAEATLRTLGYCPNLVVGDGSLGLAEHAPFDRILVAAAARHIPLAFAEQLAIGGRLVIPVGEDFDQHLLTLALDENRHWQKLATLPVRFVPLIEGGGSERA